MTCAFDLAHYRELLDAARAGGYRFATFDREPAAGDLLLRHDVDMSLEAALAMAELEAKQDIVSTYFLMTKSEFYNLDAPSGVHAFARLRELGHRIALHGVHPDATLDDRFDPVIAWHVPDPEYMTAPVPGAVNAMQPGYFHPDNYRSDSNQHWRNGCRTSSSRAGTSSGCSCSSTPRSGCTRKDDARDDDGDARRADRAPLASIRRRSARRVLSLRVLHCPVNTAGIPWANSQALRRRGVESDLLVFNRYKLHPEADIDLDRRGGLARQQATQWRAFLKLLPRYDVFHFYSSVTLVPKSVQFRILHALGKRGVYQYLGSDIRGKTREQLAYGLAADAEIVSSYDAIRWVPHADVVLPGIEVSKIEPAPPSDRKRPVILHAPSSRTRKGTEHVVAAVEALDAELRIVEGLTHDEAFELYREADIVVDQLNAGWYGVFAIECLALGKPVVTFLHDEAVRRTEEAYGTKVPLVSTTKETLQESLRPLVEDVRLRLEVGAASRAYAERLHDIDKIAGELVELYARIRA